VSTLAATIAAATHRLAAAGIDSPRLDARLLIGHVLGLDQTAIIVAPDRPVTPPEQRRIARAIARRAARLPVSRIIGKREFWSLEFRVTPATLDPRPDSETLVESVLATLPDRARPRQILDLGTGTGCLLLALLHELEGARGLGIDIAPGAVRTARRNAASLGLAERARFAVGDWEAALGRRFDLVVSNPPYLAEPELAGLEPDRFRRPRRRGRQRRRRRAGRAEQDRSLPAAAGCRA
jgi:release factor glutamine methyltransferase